jgi:hypothetical protein
MMRTQILGLALSAVALVAAQNFSINPSEVTAATRGTSGGLL